jgi:single-strand DNA-binding protein
MLNITAIGNLGKDAERNNVSGTAVLNFSIGAKSGFGDNQKTIWLDCAIWGKQAESKLADYLKKGQQVAVIGELGDREYNGKTYLTCRVDKITLCGGKQDNAQAPQQAYQHTPNPSHLNADGTPKTPAQMAGKQEPVFDDSDDTLPF